MKADNYKITQYSVSSILSYVEGAQIAIPEIQRPFVWKGREVRDLVDSLYEGYPIGYLIIWQNSQVRVRGFGKGGTKKILIDGQQRVTAMMAALMGKEVLNEQYQSERIKISFNPAAGENEEHFAVCEKAHENDPKWISDIAVFFRRDFSFRKFEKEYTEKNPEADVAGLEEAVDRLRGIVKHQVGVIELSFMLDIDVVSEIFIRINLQGKPLNQEDFAMSKIAVNEQYDGDLIRNTIDYFCHLLKEPSFMEVLHQNESEFMNTEYGRALAWSETMAQSAYVPSYADVLKVVLVACFGKSKVGDLVNLLSGKSSDKGIISKGLSKESFEKLGKGVKAFVSEHNFKGFLSALEKAGYCCDRLFYSQSVLNNCYAMYLLMEMEEISGEKRDSLIGKWMTMCLMTGHYQNAPDAAVIRDYNAIQEEGFEAYLKQIEELQLTKDFYEAILPEKYASTTARSAPFLAFLASLCAQGTSSLFNREKTVAYLYKNKAEAYQILPKRYLEKCGYKTRETYGQVANTTYISRETKAILKKKSPYEYRETIEKLYSSEEILQFLEQNVIPDELFEIDETKVEGFLLKRRKQMAMNMKKYYESL